MHTPRVLSKGISSLLLLSVLGAGSTAARAAAIIWDGGPNGSGADLGADVNWSGDTLPSVSIPDTAQWNGTVSGNLSLLYNTAVFAGAVGNAGLNLDLTSAQTASLAIDSGGNTGALRLNNVSIASGAGVFSLGDGTGVFNVILGGATGQTHTWTNDSANAAVIGKDVLIALDAGVSQSLALAGAGNWVFNDVISNGGGASLALTKSGSGALTLSGANTFTGGITLSGGLLNVGSAAALGNTTAGALSISGSSTISNTSGSALALAAAKAVNLNADLVFAGSNNITGFGTVTLGGSAGTRTLTVNSGAVSVNGIAGGAGLNFSKAGAGTLALTTTANNSTTVAGMFDIAAGVVQVSADHRFGGLTGDGTIENGGAAAKWVRTNSNSDYSFGGTLRNGASARLGYEKEGLGTFTITGAWGASGAGIDNLGVTNGKIALASTATLYVGGAGFGQVTAGSVANQNAAFEINGATLNANKTTAPSVYLGSVANGRGFLAMNSGTVNATSEVWLGGAANGFGEMTMSGGTVNSGSWFVVGRAGSGVANFDGGTLNVSSNHYTHGSSAGAIGVTNVSGSAVINTTSTAADTGGFLIGEAGNGILNMRGGAINLSVAGGRGLSISQGAGNGVANLYGGTLTTPKVAKPGTGSGILNFGGGTLRANASSATFLQGLTGAYVYAGGAAIDTNGFNITVAQPLLAPAGSGVTAIAVASGGAGYVDAPIVTVSGGSGTGATAIASVSGGVVTGFTIINPGSGYSPGDTLTATLIGGGASTAATVGAFTLGANASGGLTKTGAGTLTLSAANTYAGPTNVNVGALLLTNTTGSGTGTGAVNVNSGAVLSGVGFSAGSTTVASGGVLAPGNGGVGTLTLGALALNAGSLLDFEITDPGTRDLITVANAGGLAINGGSFRLYRPGTTATFSTNGVYNLIGYSGAVGGVGVSALSVAGATLDPAKSYTFGTAGGFVTLSIANAGSTPNFWNVDASGNWSASANWSLGAAPNGAGAIANFGGGGAAITAPRTVTLDADQTAGSIGFNSAQSYTISGTNTLTLNNDADPVAQITDSQGVHTLGVPMNAASPTTQFTILGVADVLTVSGALGGATNVVKNGSGTLVLSAANSYTGTTTVSGGTLALSGAGSLGTAGNALSMNGGTLDLGGGSLTAGAVTISAGAITNGVLTPVSFTANGAGVVSADIAGSTGVKKDGAGALSLSGNNSYTGDTVVNAGVLVIGSANALGSPTNRITFNGGALQVDGTAVTGFGAGRTLVGFPSAINIADGGNAFTIPDNLTSAGTLVKQGTGKLIMSGTSVFGATLSPSVQNGVLEIAGSVTAANTSGGIEIAPASGSAATLNVLPGATVNTSRVIIGGNTANTVGAGAGVLVQTGGVINARQWFTVGSGINTASTAASGVFTMTGGVLNASTSGTQNMEVANFAGAVGSVTISGSAVVNILNNAALALGANNGAGSGTFTQDGGTVTFYSDGGSTPGGSGGLRLGNAGTLPAASTYTYHLNGGTLATPGISRNTAAGNLSGRVFNFNGGALKATATNAAFIPSTITTNVRAGGALIDTNGFDITIASALAHDSELGATPDGGLSKAGAGTLTLAGANTYTGSTAVEAGVLVVSGSIGGTTSVNVKSGAVLDVSALNGGWTLGGQQTLKGDGLVLGAIVASSGAKIAPGQGIGALTFGGDIDLRLAVTPAASRALQFDLSAPGASDEMVLTGGALTIGAGLLGFDDFAFTIAGGLANGVYTLFDGNTAILGTLDPANRSGSLGGGLTGALSFADNGRDLVLTVVPEPGAAGLLLAGAGSLLGLRRFRRRAV